MGYRIPRIEEIVTHGRNGLLVEPGRPDLLAKEIRRLAQDPGLIGRLGAEARATIQTSYNFDTLMQCLLKVYGQALNPASVPGGKGLS